MAVFRVVVAGCDGYNATRKLKPIRTTPAQRSMRLRRRDSVSHRVTDRASLAVESAKVVYKPEVTSSR